MQKEAYLTEVHHINEDGEDAGVVYSEMQDCEHTGSNLTHRALMKALYPEGCGYRSEVGGESYPYSSPSSS